jgi:hypothetical protein
MVPVTTREDRDVRAAWATVAPYEGLSYRGEGGGRTQGRAPVRRWLGHDARSCPDPRLDPEGLRQPRSAVEARSAPTSRAARLRPTLRECVFTLLPGRVHRLANQVFRVRTGPGAELLKTPCVDFSDVQVAFLVGADAVHAPERAGKVGHGSP